MGRLGNQATHLMESPGNRAFLFASTQKSRAE